MFDWGCMLVGDFLYDLARLIFWAPWYPGLTAIDLRNEALRHFRTIGLEVPEFDARLPRTRRTSDWQGRRTRR